MTTDQSFVLFPLGNTYSSRHDAIGDKVVLERQFDDVTWTVEQLDGRTETLLAVLQSTSTHLATDYASSASRADR